jgi:hypothetical protein
MSSQTDSTRPDFASITRLVTEKAFVACNTSLPEFALLHGRVHAQSQYDMRMRAILIQLTSYMEALPDHRIHIDRSFPATWWDAFKLRWFPAWLLRRYPANFERVHVDQVIYKAVCPHLVSDPAHFHTCWMVSQRDEPVS